MSTFRDNISKPNFNYTFSSGDDSTCNLLPSASNTSLPFAANWENIPETLLVNGFIGLVIFICFLVLTEIAWKRSTSGENEDIYSQQDLISFLYGYRDPSRWYLIPRYEFLRRTGVRHQHDMNSPNLFVPPRLPLANPIDLLDDYTKSNPDDSIDGSQSTRTLKSTIVATNIQANRLSADTNQSTTKLETPNTQAQISNPSKAGTNGQEPPKNLEESQKNVQDDPHTFLYPSILTAEQLQASAISRRLNRFFSLFFRITDADIIYAKGIDAYEYLLFQRHLILIMFIINIFCLGVILPIHWFSKTKDLKTVFLATSFQQTTIKNMNENSVYYWAHLTSSVCIVILTLIILTSYRESVIDKNDSQLARRTLLVGNIPVEQRNRMRLHKIFKDYFSRVHIESIQFVYDIRELEILQSHLDSTLIAKDYCNYYKRKHNEEIMVKPTDVNEEHRCYGNCRICSFIYLACYQWPKEAKQPGTIYYRDREQYYRNKLKVLIDYLIRNPSEYAFVTFKTNRQAKRAMESLSKMKSDALNDRISKILMRSSSSSSKVTKGQVAIDLAKDGAAIKGAPKEVGYGEFLTTGSRAPNDPLNPKNNPHIKSIRSPILKQVDTSFRKKLTDEKRATDKKENSITTKLAGPIAWSVRYAPFPDNVEYYDLLHIATTSKYTIVLLHLLMIIIFIFVTTPNVLLSILERLTILQPEKAKEFTGFKGMFINYLSTLIQVITTALLPALIAQISKQIPYEDSASKNHSMMWKVYLFLVLMVIVLPSVGMNSAQAFLSTDIKLNCLFPADNGAYYINYVISSIFLSTLLELIKPVDILSYCFILMTGRSTADFESGRQCIDREFSVGMQHTSVLLIFSVVITYSISCPLIAPTGLIYLLVKHAVDHYHLFYCYFTKKVDKNLQNTIEIFVRVALLMMLFQTTVAIVINTGTSLFSLLSQIIFWFTLAIFAFNCFFHYTSRAMMSIKRGRYQREFCSCFYLPRVMEDLLRAGAIPEQFISRKV